MSIKYYQPRSMMENLLGQAIQGHSMESGPPLIIYKNIEN